MLHSGVIRQTVKVVEIIKVETGDGSIYGGGGASGTGRNSKYRDAGDNGDEASTRNYSGNVPSSLRTGDKATVRFAFCFSPEFLKIGDLLLFREGRTKALGKVSSLL
jgi:hypothetical protein